MEMQIQGFKVPSRMKLTKKSEELLKAFRVHHVAYWTASGRDWFSTMEQIVILSVANSYRVIRIDGQHFDHIKIASEVVEGLKDGRFCILRG